MTAGTLSLSHRHQHLCIRKTTYVSVTGASPSAVLAVSSPPSCRLFWIIPFVLSAADNPADLGRHRCCGPRVGACHSSITDGDAAVTPKPIRQGAEERELRVSVTRRCAIIASVGCCVFFQPLAGSHITDTISADFTRSRAGLGGQRAVELGTHGNREQGD